MSPSGGGLLFSLLLLLGMTYAQEILQAPESTVVFLDQSAVFTCETVGGVTTWRVNGTILESLPPEIRNVLVVSPTTTPEGTIVEELTIPARAEFNGTRVQCLVGIFGGSSDESENATLRIQGPPSAVVNLTVTHNSTSITISWEAPRSLDVTGVDHDIWYSVLIQNENNPTPISCTDCTNITETVYTFTLSPCHVYNFSVTPFNGAGQGESDNVTFAIAVPDTTFGEPSIKARNDSYCDVKFQVFGNLAQVCSIALRDEKGEVYVAEILEDQAVFLLPANKTYGNVSEVGSGGGVKNTTLTKILTTFDVQDPHAEPMGDGQINVTGSFINESRAFGCFIAIQCNVTTEITFIALKRRNGEQRVSEVIPMPPSNYTIHAYDLEEGAQLNTWPANPDPGNVPMIQVNGANSKPKNEENLRNASISHTGSSVVITCAPEEGTSCLVVYRAYGNSTLNVISNKTISVMVNLTNGNYTFAIFRKMNDTSVDRNPFISLMVTVGGLSTTSPPTTDDDKGGSSSSDVTGVVTGVSVAIILVNTSAIIVVVVVVVMWRQKKTRSRKPWPPSAVAPSASCTSFTKRRDEESGCGHPSRSSSGDSSEGGRSDTPLIADQLAEDGSATQPEEKEGKYAVVVTSSSGNRFHHSVDPTAVEYAILNIRATHKMARFDYTDVAPSTCNRLAIDDAKTEFPYVDVKLPNPTTTVTSPSVEKAMEKTAEEKAKSQGPPTVEAVMSLIYCVAGRWKMIASGLGFDENLIDEIYTNNGTDEACLQDCVEKWVSKLEPSWERLSLVLRYLGEERLAQQAWSGVSAECSECSEREASHEVVTGAREDTSFSDTRNDETRGKKTQESLERDEEEEEMQPFNGSYPTLQEEAPAISGCAEESDNFPTQEEGKEVSTTVHVPTSLLPNITTEDIGACVFEEIYLFSLDNACFCGKTPVFNSLKDTDIVRPAIGEQGAEQYQPHSACPGMQGSTTRATTVKAQERDFVAGGIQVVAQPVTGFNETSGVEGEETTRRAVEMQPFSEDLCASTECTDIGGRQRRAVFPSLHIVVEKKMLVVSYDQLLPDRSETLLLKKDSPDPPPESTPPQQPAEVAVEELSPEPTPPQQVAVEELSPEPTPPQEPAEVAVEEMGENSPPPTRPPTLPPSSRMEVGATTQTKNNTLPFLDPPENFKEKVVKWLYTGVALGFHGPGSLFRLCSRSSPIW